MAFGYFRLIGRIDIGPLDPEYFFAFVEEVNRAGRDAIYWVRREATYALGALAKVVPEELLYTSLVSVLAALLCFVFPLTGTAPAFPL